MQTIGGDRQVAAEIATVISAVKVKYSREGWSEQRPQLGWCRDCSAGAYSRSPPGKASGCVCLCVCARAHVLGGETGREEILGRGNIIYKTCHF